MRWASQLYSHHVPTVRASQSRIHDTGIAITYPWYGHRNHIPMIRASQSHIHHISTVRASQSRIHGTGIAVTYSRYGHRSHVPTVRASQSHIHGTGIAVTYPSHNHGTGIAVTYPWYGHRSHVAMWVSQPCNQVAMVRASQSRNYDINIAIIYLESIRKTWRE